MKVKSNVKAGGISINHGQAARGLRIKPKVTAGLVATLLVLSLAQALVLADTSEEQARKERQFQACMRPAKNAHQRAVKEAQQEKARADRQAQDDFKAAMHKAKHDAERTAAKKARQEALIKAKDALRNATREAQAAMKAATESCRNPQPPETASNNTGKNDARGCGADNPAAGTLGHGPRGRNSVRMDLRVVDEAGKPVQGAKTKLWSERQSNGMFCETVHTTGECGNVLMDPIHITKTLQLKLEAKGFKPQMIQVDPAQLDRPFQVVMQTK